MAAKVIEIADALKDELNGQTFSQPFTAVRAYQPTYELKDMAALHVTVVPKSVTATPGSRAGNFHDYAIDVGVQKKFEQEADIDALMALAQEIAGFLNRRRLGACPDVAWVRTRNDPIFVPEHVGELRQFTSVITVTYRCLE